MDDQQLAKAPDIEVEEAVFEQEEEATTQPAFDQETFQAVVGLIQRLSQQLDELKDKQKEFKDRMRNISDNDTQLQTFEEQAEQATLAFKKRKKELLELPESKEIQGKLREIGEEVKEIQESLTNNLLSYYQMTGVQTFDTPDGSEREFKLNARLLPNKK